MKTRYLIAMLIVAGAAFAAMIIHDQNNNPNNRTLENILGKHGVEISATIKPDANFKFTKNAKNEQFVALTHFTVTIKNTVNQNKTINLAHAKWMEAKTNFWGNKFYTYAGDTKHMTNFPTSISIKANDTLTLEFSTLWLCKENSRHLVIDNYTTSNPTPNLAEVN